MPTNPVRVVQSTVATAAVLLTSVLAGAATPLGSAFTYQGRLNLNGNPVNGLTDMKLSLFDDTSAGNQVGSTLTFAAGGDGPPVNFANGLFAVDLDFGSTAFNGSARWLKVEVRSPAGVGGYTTLAPRQAINPTAYAMFSKSGGDSFLRGMLEYASPGNFTFTVPEGVTRLLVEAWSGGGGGGSSYVSGSLWVQGTAGGSGGYARLIVPVASGDELDISVGVGGMTGAAGGQTTVSLDPLSGSPTTIIEITGGLPGLTPSVPVVSSPPGAGGTVQTLVGVGIQRVGNRGAFKGPVGVATFPCQASYSYGNQSIGTMLPGPRAPGGTVDPPGANGGSGGGASTNDGFTFLSCAGFAGGDGYVLIQW